MCVLSECTATVDMAIALEIEEMRPILDISVRNPSTRKFTTYEIAIQTSDPAFSLCRSKTRRRFNEYRWLRTLLKQNHPLISPPELPPSKLFQERFDVQFIVQRMSELEGWLYRIVTVNLYQSDSALHLFLQTTLSCGQIDDYLAGKLAESVVESSRRQCDDRHSSPENNDGFDSSNKTVSFEKNPGHQNEQILSDWDTAMATSPSESESESMTASSYDSSDSQQVTNSQSGRTVTMETEVVRGHVTFERNLRSARDVNADYDKHGTTFSDVNNKVRNGNDNFVSINGANDTNAHSRSILHRDLSQKSKSSLQQISIQAKRALSHTHRGKTETERDIDILFSINTL